MMYVMKDCRCSVPGMRTCSYIFFLGGGNVWKYIRAELGSKCFSRRSSLQAVCVILRSRVLHVSDIIRARKSSRASMSNAKYEFISFYYTYNSVPVLRKSKRAADEEE